MNNHETIFPKVLFAHKITMNEYNNFIQPSPNNVEITVVTEGEVNISRGSYSCTVKSHNILFYDDSINDGLHVYTTSRHTHHTVGCLVNSTIKKLLSVYGGIICMPDDSSVCLNLIDKIIKTLMIDRENTLKVSGLCLQLLGELSNIYRTNQQTNSPSEQRYIEQTKKYIYSHISEPILQKDIANYLNITPEYLCAIFKKMEGCSVLRFINETKLTQIRLLMANTRCSLGQAAMQYGFSDPNYVSKLYKKYYFESITQSIRKLK